MTNACEIKTRQQTLEILFNRVDVSKLTRDYRSNPLKRVKGVYDYIPPKQDIYYLYVDCLFSIQTLCSYLGVSYPFIKKFLKLYGIHPTKELKTNQIQAFNLVMYGSKMATGNKVCQQKIKNTCVEKYGVEHPNKTLKEKERLSKQAKDRYETRGEEIKQKYKQTCLNKYGWVGYHDKEKQKATKLERYGDEHYNNQEKRKQTCIRKYGVPFAQQTEAVKQKAKQTSIERYGVDHFTKTELYKRISTNPDFVKKSNEARRKTCEARYGVDYVAQTEHHKNAFRKTCEERYGVSNYTKTKDYQEKAYNTRKCKRTFSCSKIEDKIYSLLLQKFPDVKRQYRDQRYPFSCDFYIPRLDLFIEYNGSWVHGYHKYDKNEPRDLRQVEVWKNKANEINFKGKPKTYYNYSVKVWTESDPLKRETALKNKLNWIEFFNEREFNDWFENFK